VNDLIDWALAAWLAVMVLAAVMLLLTGCGAAPDTVTQPGPDAALRVEHPGAYALATEGAYSNAPRLPRVNVVIASDGSWVADVGPVPGFTCQGVPYAVRQPMYFQGTGAVDTTAHLLDFWQSAVNGWPAYGYFEADYRQSWPARDTVLVGLIEGRWIMSVYGECQAAQERPFWITR